MPLRRNNSKKGFLNPQFCFAVTRGTKVGSLFWKSGKSLNFTKQFCVRVCFGASPHKEKFRVARKKLTGEILPSEKPTGKMLAYEAESRIGHERGINVNDEMVVNCETRVIYEIFA